MFPGRRVIKTQATTTCTVTSPTLCDPDSRPISVAMPTGGACAIDRTESRHAVRAPVVKEELKQAIQSRRACLGLGQLTLPIANDKKVQQQLSPEEELRIIRRRERNKQAASRCRDKRKRRIEDLEREASALEEDNAQIEKDMDALRAEQEQLEKILKNHNCVLHRSTLSKDPKDWNS